jgi:acetyl-CoA carboxylase biotin carboxyl carrier protein
MDKESRNQVEALFRLFREQGLIELEVEDGSFKLSLRREAPPGAPAPAAPRARRRTAAPQPRTGKGRTVAVRSPLIGVFYRAPAPDMSPFVEIGDVVSVGQTVCVVEAMKVFNEIKAEWKGRVVAVPAREGALVQAGDPLIVLEFADAKEQEEA